MCVDCNGGLLCYRDVKVALHQRLFSAFWATEMLQTGVIFWFLSSAISILLRLSHKAANKLVCGACRLWCCGGCHQTIRWLLHPNKRAPPFQNHKWTRCLCLCFGKTGIIGIMEGHIEREYGALGGLFHQIIQDMKVISVGEVFRLILYRISL